MDTASILHMQKTSFSKFYPPYVGKREKENSDSKPGQTRLSQPFQASPSRRRKTLILNRGRWSSLSLFRQIHLGEGKLRFQTGAASQLATLHTVRRSAARAIPGTRCKAIRLPCVCPASYQGKFQPRGPYVLTNHPHE